MNNTMQAAAVGSNESLIFPITMEEVNARLSSFKGNSPAGNRVDSARRIAWFNEKAAQAKLDIRELDFDSILPAESKGRLALERSVEIEGCHACRRLEGIFADLSRAAEALEKTAAPSKAADEFIKAGAAEIAALENRISELRARSGPVLYGKINRLKRELRQLTEVMIHGNWKEVPTADKADMLDYELNQLVFSGHYAGPCTEEAAKARISEIEQDLAKLIETKNNQLTEEEVREAVSDEGRISEIKAGILNQERIIEMNSANVRAAEQDYSEQLESALVSAESIVRVYQINCERLALGLP